MMREGINKDTKKRRKREKWVEKHLKREREKEMELEK